MRERSLGTISTSVPPLSLIVVAARAQHTRAHLSASLFRYRETLFVDGRPALVGIN